MDEPNYERPGNGGGGVIPQTDDAALMSRLRAGDREALAELVRRHQHRVLDVALRFCGDRELAEDIGQEVFLRVWRSAARYRPTAQFRTWLYRIVVNLCLDERKRRRPVAEDVADRPDQASSEPVAMAASAEIAASVRRAVAQLPERQQVALILHRFADLPQRAIAEATGWSESAVESLLVRAYANLRDALQEFMEQ